MSELHRRRFGVWVYYARGAEALALPQLQRKLQKFLEDGDYLTEGPTYFDAFDPITTDALMPPPGQRVALLEQYLLLTDEQVEALEVAE